MSKGFRKDPKITNRLRENGFFLDRRSFLGYDLNFVPHLVLAGPDMSTQRSRVWVKSKGKCKMCGRAVNEDFELDHIQGGLSGRCSCTHNLQILCHDCHIRKHNRYPKFGSGRAQAIKQFNEVNQ